MEIVHKNYDVNGSFYLLDGTKIVGEIDYSWVNDNTFAITHTEVHPEYQGKGYARQLVDAAADYARKNNLRIIPICQYAKAVMLRTNAFQDVLVKL